MELCFKFKVTNYSIRLSSEMPFDCLFADAQSLTLFNGINCRLKYLSPSRMKAAQDTFFIHLKEYYSIKFVELIDEPE